MSRPVTTVALLARPEWQGCPEETRDPVDPRIWPAPLQALVPEPTREDLRSAVIAFSSQPSSTCWLVFTSPASVIAYQHWVRPPEQRLSPVFDRLAAVGSGTADQMRRSDIESDRAIMVGADAASADALATVEAIANQLKSDGMDWHDQSFVIVGGVDNRSTLADGLRAHGATVMSLPLYSRQDVEWSDVIWKRLSEFPHETVIVITSSTVIERLMQSLVTHGIDPVSLHWATHHATIAARLSEQRLGRIRRVRLDPPELSRDLFEHEQYW